MSQFNTFTSHPLIPNENNYTLSKKVVSVHSVDRDIARFPFSNTFSIKLPESILNCQTMRLSMAQFPNKLYNLCNEYQNTKMSFTVNGNNYEVVIADGFYTPDKLAMALTNKMSKVSGSNIIVHHNSTENKFGFVATGAGSFSINAGIKHSYQVKQTGQGSTFEEYADWGLPFYIGFDKSSGNNVVTDSIAAIPYIGSAGDLEDDTLTNPLIGSGRVIIAPNPCRLIEDRVIYMEVDKYNSLDEIYPFSNTSDYVTYPNNPSTNPSAYGTCTSEGGQALNIDGFVPRRARATTKTFSARDCRAGLQEAKNKQSGHPQAAFAKIPLSTTDNFITAPNSFSACTYFNPPNERMSDLSFKFRRHDGRLIHFHETPFNFSLEFFCLQAEQAKKINVTVPPGYNV